MIITLVLGRLYVRCIGLKKIVSKVLMMPGIVFGESKT